MELKYLKQLTKEEIYELINYCTAKDGMFHNKIFGYKELDYIEEYGNGRFLVCVGKDIVNENNVCEDFFVLVGIKDYEMWAKIDFGKKIDYSKELNEFMTERFGLTYVQDLVKKRYRIFKMNLM